MAETEKTLEERIAALEAHTAMLDRLAAFESYHGGSIPEQLHRIRMAMFDAANAFLGAESDDAIPAVNSPWPIDRAFVRPKDGAPPAGAQALLLDCEAETWERMERISEAAS